MVCESRLRGRGGCTAAQEQTGDNAGQGCLQAARLSSALDAGGSPCLGQPRERTTGGSAVHLEVSTKVNGSGVACAWVDRQLRCRVPLLPWGEGVALASRTHMAPRHGLRCCPACDKAT